MLKISDKINGNRMKTSIVIGKVSGFIGEISERLDHYAIRHFENVKNKLPFQVYRTIAGVLNIFTRNSHF